jgi:ATP-dependent Clp protease ATP-binding subunit ClpC
LNRAIQKYLEDPVAEEILKGDLREGDTLMADHEEGTENLVITVKKKEEEVIN